jgi:hypothetical protein
MSAKMDKLIGVACRPFTKTVGGRAYRGYVSRSEFSADEAGRYALAMWPRLRAAGVRLFAGWVKVPRASLVAGGVRLYALAGVSESDIADLADVGVSTGAGNTAGDWARAIAEEEPDGYLAEQLKSGEMTLEDLADDPDKDRARMRRFFEAVHRRCPFEIYFAAHKACAAAFVKAVTRADAAWLEKKILDVNPEAMDVAEGGSVREHLLRKGEMSLWWD